MKTRFLFFIGLLLVAIVPLRTRAGTVPLVPAHPTCFELAAAGNHFIALGEEGAVTEITRYWNKVQNDFSVESSAREQIGWICRMIFVPKPKAVLRRPMFGGHWLPLDSFQDTDWPYYPLAESRGIFFVLAEGYFLAGYPEDPLKYVAYCRANGVFRREQLHLPSDEEAGHALELLLSSEAWRKIRWKDSGTNFYYEMSAAPVVKFLKVQTRERTQKR